MKNMRPLNPCLRLLIIASLITLFFQQDMLWRSVLAPLDRIALPIVSNRTMFSDQYHYYLAIKNKETKLFRQASHLNDFDQPHQKHAVDGVYCGAIAIALLCDVVSHIVSSPRFQVYGSLFLQTLLFVFSFLFALKILIRPKQPLYAYEWLIAGFFSLFFLKPFQTSAFYFQWISQTSLTNEPNILRIINPQMGWAFGLLFLTQFLKFLEEQSQKQFLTVLIFSSLIGLFSISLALIYFLSIGCYFLIKTVLERKISLKAVLLLMSLLCSFLFSYYQLKLFQMDIKGSEIGTGGFLKWIIRPHYLWFSLLGIFVYYFNEPKHRLFLLIFFEMSLVIAMFCESLHLGERLWGRGGSILVWILLVALFWKVVLKKGQFFHKAPVLVLGLLIPLLGAISYRALQINSNTWYGMVEREKWQMVEWINHHIPASKIVLSDDIEINFLLSLYTRVEPLVSMFDTNDLSVDSTIKRYFFALRILNHDSEIMPKILNYQSKDYYSFIASNYNISEKIISDDVYQPNAFYAMIVYYPFTKTYTELLDHDSKKFYKHLVLLHDQIKRDLYPFDYTIYKKSDSIHLKNIVFENSKFVVSSVSP